MHQSKELDYLKQTTVPKTKIVELQRKMGMALMGMNVLESGRESEEVISMKTLLQEMQRTINYQNKKIKGQACDIAQLTKKLELASKGMCNGQLAREDFPRTAVHGHCSTKADHRPSGLVGIQSLTPSCVSVCLCREMEVGDKRALVSTDGPL